MIAMNSPHPIRKPAKKVPEYMIYEIMDGKPVYYKGYKDVLAGRKTFSEIMGSSRIQSLIVTHLILLLGKFLDDTKFTILSSEAGIHLNKYNNLAGDILVFDNETMPIEMYDEHYADVPPKVVIEVDITADTTDLTPDGYIYTKTQKLLDFGVEKVIWITTRAKKITIATPNEDWQVKDWNKDVEVFDGITFNIEAYLRRKGSPYA